MTKPKAAAQVEGDKRDSLARVFGLRDLTLLIIGSVIGSGIFLVPGAVLSQTGGRIGPAMMVWVAGGVLSLLGALTYGELSAMNPKVGGLYVYIRDCFGPLPAFLFGWTLFFAISGGTVATLAVAFSANLGEVIPMSPFTARVVAIGMIVVLTAVNVRGTRQSADMQNWMTAIKVGVLIVMSVALLSLGKGFQSEGAGIWPDHVDGALASGFGLAMLSVLWAYEGWQYGTFSAGETLNPRRNFPRAFLLSITVLIFIYLLANFAYLAAIGPGALANSNSAAAAAVSAVVSPTAAKLVAIAIAISIFSAANVNVLTSPRVYYAMARDGLFFRRLADVHPRFQTPAFAVITGSAWAIVLAVTGTFEQLLTYVVFTGWLFYALGAACVFVYRKQHPEMERPYQVPGYPWTPALFILAAGALVVNTVVAQPKTAAIGLSIVFTGVPAYLIWRSRDRSNLKATGEPAGD